MKRDVTRKAADPSRSVSEILVIGFGNTLRRDDGAGLILAEALVADWLAQGIAVELLTTTQLLPELAASIGKENVNAVVFVDATVQNTQSAIQIVQIGLDSTSPSLGHHLDPATLLVYAALLYGRTPLAWLVSIPGRAFEHGQNFSPEVMRLLADAPALATHLLTKIESTLPCMNLPLLKH
jgi:hydrogenase maturation protease